MSEFKTKSITTKGMELLSKALSGEQLEFTRIEMGSGNFEGDIGSVEALVEVRQSLPINKIARKGSQVTLSTSLKIEAITTPFEWTEIGVYARGEDNVEVLYMYGHTTNSSYISKDSLNEKLINVTVLVASTTQVTAVIDKSLVYLTAEALKEHESDEEAHQDIRASVEEIQRQVEGLDVSWEGIQNKPTEFQPIDHTHAKAQITDFPSSLPANGGNADTVGGKQFNWSFGTKAPTHLWGSEGSSTEQYVYQPSQVSVGHAVNADKIGNVAVQNIAVYLGSNPSTSIINNPAHSQNYDCWVHSTQATAIGLPDAGNWHLSYKKHLNVDGYGTQIAMPYGKNEMYMRASNGKVWLTWERVGGDINTFYRPSNTVRYTMTNPSKGLQSVLIGRFTASKSGIIKIKAKITNKVGHVTGEVTMYSLIPTNYYEGSYGMPRINTELLMTTPLGSTINSSGFKTILTEGGVGTFTVESCFAVERGQLMLFGATGVNSGESTITNIQLCYDEIKI